ncbi:GGDEF domain-containing protein [Thermomonas sp.]|jgi:diguanylate cyclase (GGDEF)-like protein|uniref:GGDEF domain-containing protein n=1 Tax=Thermomonas sp. TaxID=1971895 RepID=UPI00257FF4F5|nr:GGDEF domain-containing protein [Thermomonas sp.]
MNLDFVQSRWAMRGYRLYWRLASLMMIVVGLGSSVEWAAGINLVPDLGGRDMRLTAAFCVLLSGLALAAVGTERRWIRRLASLLCAIVIGLAANSLLEYSGIGYRGIAAWLDSALGEGLRPSTRMAELAACGFLLLGGQGLLILNGRALVLRELFGLGVLAIAMASLASFAFVLAQHGESLLERLPILTGVLLLIGTLGWMSSVPTTGLTRVSTAATLGGVLARSLLLPALLLPLAYTFAFKLLETRLGVSQVVASTLGAVFTGGSLAWMIWLVAALLDRSERLRDTSQRLRHAADTDALTGLGNRRKLDAVLQGLLHADRRQRLPFSLLMLDLDHFKPYNDAFGHQAGDDALREIGRLLRATLRPEDAAFRYGGEEFVLVIHGIHLHQLPAIAERVLHAVRANDWPLRPLTTSIGGAEACDADVSAESLLQRADAALYRAKHNGRDRFERTGCAECLAGASGPESMQARSWEQPPPGCRAASQA